MTVPVAGETMAELPAVLDELAGAGYSDIWTSEVNATDVFAPLLIAARQTPRLRLGTSIARLVIPDWPTNGAGRSARPSRPGGGAARAEGGPYVPVAPLIAAKPVMRHA